MTALATAPSPVRSGRDTLRLVFDPVGADRRAAEDCEADVFMHRFGDDRELLEECFGPHEAATTWLALIDADGVAVASCRMIVPSPDPLKLEVYLSEDPWSIDPSGPLRAAGLDMASTWDVASISVRPRSHGQGALWTAGLCHGLFQVARVNEVSATVAVMDEGARALLAANGIIYSTLPGTWTAEFCGSPASTPVYADMQTMIAHQRRAFPDAYRLVTLGIGLDGIELPEPSAYRLRPRELDLRDGEQLPAPVGGLSARPGS